MEKREEDHVEHTEKACIIANFSIRKDWRAVFHFLTLDVK